MKTTCEFCKFKRDCTARDYHQQGPISFPAKPTKQVMPSPGASPIPTWLLLVLMAFGAKRQRVDRRGSQAAGDGDACQGHDGDGPLSTANASRTVTALKTVTVSQAVLQLL